jgi:hypothetical protein
MANPAVLDVNRDVVGPKVAPVERKRRQLGVGGKRRVAIHFGHGNIIKAFTPSRLHAFQPSSLHALTEEP